MAEIAAWNIKDALSDDARNENSQKTRAQMVVESLTINHPPYDAVVLSEAYHAEDRAKAVPWLKELSRSGNYTVFAVDEERFDDRPDAHGVALLVKKELLVRDPTFIPLAGRYALRATLRDSISQQPYHLFGYHGNDKNEELREADARRLGDYLPLEGGQLVEPTVLAGDLNAMEGSSATAVALKGLRPFARLLPAEAPDPNNPPRTFVQKVKRVGSLTQRSTEMAIGRTMALYQSYGFKNADKNMIPTISERGLSLKLDHILTSRHFVYKDHFVHLPNAAEQRGIYTPASDHRAISALLRVESDEVSANDISPSE